MFLMVYKVKLSTRFHTEVMRLGSVHSVHFYDFFLFEVITLKNLDICGLYEDIYKIFSYIYFHWVQLIRSG